MVTVLLCAHNLLIRTGLRKVLEDDAYIHVAAEAGSADEAVELAQRHQPDVVFVELDMPHGEGLRIGRMLTGTGDRPAGVVFIAQSFDSATALRGLLAGARAFLAKSDTPRQLVAAVHAVAGGYTVLPSAVTAALEPWAMLSTAFTAPASSDVFGLLTDRELEVLRLLATGMSNGEIAGFLSLGEATVKSHVSRLLSKLGLRNRSQAVARAYGTGLMGVPARAAQ
ncbi:MULTISPECIES: LuxR C-terminal-related transcriptional regulator [Streptomyces]|uniref:Response regulator transcription factor n=1 Tax=Streptomyces morookaense TaxID=1970 RepID=A0A7Y7B383_STRMO|nr:MULTISPECIES: response regulator transcription factor [Streptomyces]MCC2279290.1 response regulator transcription factor [Streptomyces sp. ET3-23]NVK78215.1 response regulator transcription factor [Streptomyces morookaense]GHF31346.1 DNA-binding response regulator [Streptomyces morookaense]